MSLVFGVAALVFAVLFFPSGLILGGYGLYRAVQALRIRRAPVAIFAVALNVFALLLGLANLALRPGR